MKTWFNSFCGAVLAGCFATLSGPVRAAEFEADVVVYGNTSAGVIAAQQVLAMGRSVIVTGPDRHLGGLSAGGLGWTDSGRKEAIGGLSLQFYQRIYDAYQKPTTWKWQTRDSYGNRAQGTDAMDSGKRAMWVFEPSVAEAVFEDIVREHKITVHRDRWLDREAGVTVKDARIVSIRMTNGDVYKGRMFIDATYEGDLMAAAGVSFTTGREANSMYGETLNGVQTAKARSHQFAGKIDPYRIPGDPSSGLLPRIHDGHPGEEGAGDHRIQAYNFRMCMTNHEANRVPFPKPEGYDPDQYELLLRTLLAGSRHIFGKFDPFPNHKTDTNNHGSFSTDNIGMNYDYPTGSYERRKEIIEEHRRYQMGYHYFLANDPRVPEEVRTRYATWGLPADEFKDNGHWPHQIYVREARRMVSDFVVTENHLTRKQPTPHPVGMGSYNMDSHHTQRYVARDADGKAYVRNEGDIQVSPGGPYPIDFGAIVPKKAECENLVVPVCVSSSHIAYGSIRMEPVFMILAQSGATAACLALDSNIAVQDVPYESLQQRLIADGQVLELTTKRAPAGVKSKVLEQGIVMDVPDAKRTGPWIHAQSLPGYVGSGYAHDNDANKGACVARFEKTLESGKYRVIVHYVAHENRSNAVPVSVIHRDGTTDIALNQKLPPSEKGLGVFEFDASKPAVVELSNKGTTGHVIIDAVQWIKQ